MDLAAWQVDPAARPLDPAARPLDPAVRPLDPAVYKPDPAVAVLEVMLRRWLDVCGIFASDCPLLVTSFPVERFLTL